VRCRAAGRVRSGGKEISHCTVGTRNLGRIRSYTASSSTNSPADISRSRPSAKFSLDGDSLADLPMGLGRRALFAVCRLVIRWTTPRCHLRPFSFPRLLPREREGGEPDRSIDKACERA